MAWHPVSHIRAAQQGVGNQKQPNCFGWEKVGESKSWMPRQ